MIDHKAVDADDIGSNNSGNTSFDTVLRGFLSRRQVLKGSAGTAAALLVGGGIAGCSDDDEEEPPATVLQLNFDPVAKSIQDALTVPAGYTASVLYALGDPISAAVPAYTNLGTESGASFALRAGDHHDGMEYFGLSAAGTTSDPNSSTRGVIAINHENITQIYLHAVAPSTAPRVADEALKEINAHGVAMFEVTRASTGVVSVVANSTLNRRITPNTPMDLKGPAAGSAWMRTQRSNTGATSFGTLNNCATGRTPWGTFLTCEENWAGYFRRNAGDNATRGGDASRSVLSLNRYTLPQGQAGSYNWASATATDPADLTFRRWNITQTGVTTDGSDDFRNEAFTFGYVVEADPFNPATAPRKRTAMGRMGHEAAAYGTPVVGQPIVYYMGDDARGEYVYKYVSTAVWASADATGGMAAGDKYLDAGTLYVAKFNSDGTGTWLPLRMSTAAVAAAPFGFTSEADICVHTRIAADAVGATKMDRPEWTAVNPRNGDVYVTMTNNNSAFRSANQVDAANPRSYGTGTGSNSNGHIIRLKEASGLGTATSFQWDIYLFGSPAALDPVNVNISGLTDVNDFSSPDGIWFDRQGVCWIQTDDGAYTGTTNCMMLAAIPGAVGDGASRVVTNTTGGGSTSTVTTYVAAAANANPTNLRRFLVGPVGCEITGITMTPDLRTLFVNIQHPGETGTLSTLQSTWPAAPGSGARPRSATVVIRKNDGGTIGGSQV